MGVIDLAHADEIASKTHNDEAEYDSKKGLLVGICKTLYGSGCLVNLGGFGKPAPSIDLRASSRP